MTGTMPKVVFGIESSCDETAAAVAVSGSVRHVLLSNIVSSQLDVHRKYGGVVPEIASRKHLEAIMPVIHEAMTVASKSPHELDGIAVTFRPGLVGALVVGLSAAKALALAWDLPIVGVNHVLGHIYAGFAQETGDKRGPGRVERKGGRNHEKCGDGNEAGDARSGYVDTAPVKPPEFPFVALVVSGGHSTILHMTSHCEYEVAGRTRDDAAGEAFDKVARLIGLGYPGGPAIDALAKSGDPEAVRFPRAHLEPGSLDFSFSGLKTAVALYMEKSKRKGKTVAPEDLAASFQEAVCDILVEKTMKAAQMYGVNQVLLAGGVAANSRLRAMLKDSAREQGVSVIIPPVHLCTDNAGMIAVRGIYLFEEGLQDDLHLNASPDSPVS